VRNGAAASGSKRKLVNEVAGAIGEDGSEVPDPFSADVDARESRRGYVVDDACLWRDGRRCLVCACMDVLICTSVARSLDAKASSWNSRHDSRCRAIRDSRRSWGEVRVVGTGTIAVFGTVRRADWKELRRLFGLDRTVLRDAEREWLWLCLCP
jgi:hypothetical protein